MLSIKDEMGCLLIQLLYFSMLKEISTMLVSYYNIWRNKTRQSHTFMHYDTGCDHPEHTPRATAKTYFYYLINLIFSLMVSGSVMNILSCHTPLNVNAAV